MLPHNSFFLISIAVLVFFFFLRFLSRTSLLFFIKQCWISMEDRFHAHQIFKIPRFNQTGQENQLYRRVLTYINSLSTLDDSDFTNLFAKSPNEIVLSLDPNQTVVDTFLSSRMLWSNHAHIDAFFELSIRRKDRRRILRPYLQHIHAVSDEIEQRRRSDLKLYFNFDHAGDDFRTRWRQVPFIHPSTIENLVIDPDLKNRVKNDLDLFLKSKQYFHRLGRIWKRSYLLCGEDRTGKSSFIAAMAKLLCYDIYDVDLSRISDALDLKALLLQTTSKSLIVIEDLDSFISKKSLSTYHLDSFFNFTDGVFASCVEERVMVFSVKKDPNQTVPNRFGKIDVYVHFPSCDFSVFKALANTHLGLKEHKLFPQVEESFLQSNRPSLSPTEIGEIMMSNRGSPSRALKSVISALQLPSGGTEKTKTMTSLTTNGSGQVTDVEDPDTVTCSRESMLMVREFRKLSGLLRMRSGRKDETPPFEET